MSSLDSEVDTRTLYMRNMYGDDAPAISRKSRVSLAANAEYIPSQEDLEPFVGVRALIGVRNSGLKT